MTEPTVGDVDLAALTEAVANRLEAEGIAFNPETETWPDTPLDLVVRVVLEALPREWGARTSTSSGHVARLTWERDEATARAVHASRGLQELTPAFDIELVWRAVGPPIPAEDQP